MATTTNHRRRTYDQACPVAHALDQVGERWTLLIVRDLMFGSLRFTELRDGLPGLAPNLLSDRLRWLVAAGIVEKVARPPSTVPVAYALTPRGRELGPVVQALARFGVDDWVDPDEAPPPRRLLRGALLALMTPQRLGPNTWSARLTLPVGTVGLVVGPPDDQWSALARLRLADPPEPDAPSPDLEVTTTLGVLVGLFRDELTRDEAERSGRLVIRGPEHLVAELAILLGWPPAHGEASG